MSDVKWLTDDDLRGLGVPLGPRKRMLAAFSDQGVTAQRDSGGGNSSGKSVTVSFGHDEEQGVVQDSSEGARDSVVYEDTVASSSRAEQHWSASPALGSTSRQGLRQRLRAFYAQRQPDRQLGDVDLEIILDQWEGNEEELFAELGRKY